MSNTKAKRPRNVRVVRKIAPGPAVVCVEGSGKRTWYLIREREPDRGPPVVRVFAVVRLGATFAYTVCAAPRRSCECPGWLSHGHCVHVGLIAALIQAKKI